ncbi:unnamed protein product [Calypogeia fissa]
MRAGGVCLRGDVATMHPNYHRPLHDIVDTYGQYGADNLSLWLTNAKEAAAKITEATQARQKEKEEKYGKFLRELHSRVVVASSKEKNLSKIPPARPRRLPFGQINTDSNLRRSKFDGSAGHDRGRGLGPIFKEVPKMDKVRVYLEKELQKNSKHGNGISKLHRECMVQALVRQKAMDPLVKQECSNDNMRGDKMSMFKKTDSTFPKLLPKPFYVPLPPIDSAQVPEFVNSEPCTPTGWNYIPTSFSALEMRSLESATSPTPPDTTEVVDDEVNPTPVSSPSPKGNSKQLHVESCGRLVLGRSQSSLNRFSRVGRTQMRGKENITSNTSTGNWIVNDNTETCTKEPLGKFVSSDIKPKQSQCEASVSGSSLSTEGVTTCPMGVVVLKGREEYDMRGQGKQFFSDVWKCAMEVERRCAHERAHFLYVLEKKRLEQQKAEKRHKAEMLREKSIAKQREAVQMQLKSVAALKARREEVVQHHRAVEKKRFSQALQVVRMEKMQAHGVQVPPLCNCGHGVHPLNVKYFKKCHNDCPLQNNFPEYALQLENKLQQLLDDFNASSYSTNDLHWPSTGALYDSYSSCC